MSEQYSHIFGRFFNLTRVFAKIAGVDIVYEGYRMTWRTWCLIALIHIAIAFTFYTMYILKDWIEAVKCLTIFFTAIQGYAKLINALKQKKLLSSVRKETFALYEIYEKRTKNYHVLLADSIKLVKKLMVILLGIIFFTIAYVIGVPVLYQFVYHERIFVMAIFLPIVDPKTDLGYYMNFVFHVTCVVFGIAGNFVSDSWCFIFAAHFPLYKNILQTKLKEMDELLEEGDNKEEIKIQELLLDIFKWHQQYNAFCKRVKGLFYWVIFVQVSTSFVAIACTIVCVFLKVWPAAHVYLFYSFAMFYSYCALGNLVEVSNDDVVLMIYDCCWYKLTVSQQKMIMIMLRESQQAEGISIGGVAPLSMHTALQMTKTIYTFSMMLSNYLN